MDAEKPRDIRHPGQPGHQSTEDTKAQAGKSLDAVWETINTAREILDDEAWEEFADAMAVAGLDRLHDMAREE